MWWEINLFYDDTSTRGNKCAHLYADSNVFVHVFPMRFKAAEGDSLGNAVKDIGIMNEIHYENALEQVGINAEFISKDCKYNINVSSNESYSPCHNKAKYQI